VGVSQDVVFRAIDQRRLLLRLDTQKHEHNSIGVVVDVSKV
jgi:hypothetical protein